MLARVEGPGRDERLRHEPELARADGRRGCERRGPAGEARLERLGAFAQHGEAGAEVLAAFGVVRRRRGEAGSAGLDAARRVRVEPRDGVDRRIGRIVADLGLREEHRVPVARGVFAAFRHDGTGELLPEADQLEPGRRRLARNRVPEQEGGYRGEGGLRGVGARQQ